MTDLKTVIATALNNEFFLDTEGDYSSYVYPDGTVSDAAINHSYNFFEPFSLDRLSQTIRDHVFDRSKVRAAIMHACDGDGIICDDPLIIERTIDDEFIDRLIEALAGGPQS